MDDINQTKHPHICGQTATQAWLKNQIPSGTEGSPSLLPNVAWHYHGHRDKITLHHMPMQPDIWQAPQSQHQPTSTASQQRKQETAKTPGNRRSRDISAWIKNHVPITPFYPIYETYTLQHQEPTFSRAPKNRAFLSLLIIHQPLPTPLQAFVLAAGHWSTDQVGGQISKLRTVPGLNEFQPYSRLWRTSADPLVALLVGDFGVEIGCLQVCRNRGEGQLLVFTGK